MIIGDVIKAIEEIAPIELAEHWDNVGLLIGDEMNEIGNILVTLDVTPEVVDEAIANGVKLIISHHPLIFKPLDKIVQKNVIGSMILKLIKNNISLYSSHTNCDIAYGGLNDILCDKIALKDREVLSINPHSLGGASYGVGRIGYIRKGIIVSDLINKVKSVLCINNVVFAGDKNKTVSKIAVCTGSGGSLVQDCISNNVEVFLTGELKYSEAQLAVQNGINIISTGHYESEIIFIPFIVDYLTKYFTGVNFFINASKANNSILRTM